MPLVNGPLSSKAEAAAGETSSSTRGIDTDVAGSSYLVSASRDFTVKLWDLETGFCTQTISDHFDWVRCIAIRESDGARMATSGNDLVIFVYDVTTTDRKKIAELRGHEHVVETLSFVVSSSSAVTNNQNNNKITPSEKKHLDTVNDYIASGGRDKTVRLWSLATSQCIMVFKAHENWVRSIVLHPSGNIFLT